MIERPLKIGEWLIDFLFETDEYDVDEVLSRLRNINANERTIRRAKDIMSKGRMNNGFTVSNEMMKQIVVMIGPTSSGDEFLDTFVHEIQHVAVVIADSLGVDLRSETPAYIAGDAARTLAGIVCMLGCPHCREY